ncbi:MAG: YfhO family protein, partial [Planctomycetia bacterium]|nr:YfhO family protein [Planctomycetia bacterium]
VLRRPNVRAMVLFSATLAMMVLGGEPQSVYFVAAILLGLAFVYRRPRIVITKRKKLAKQPGLLRRLAFGPVAMLFYSACFAVVLAGIQFVPTAEFARHSERNWNTIPLGLWDVPGFLMNRNSQTPITLPNPEAVNARAPVDAVLDGLFCRTLHEGGTSQSLYDYSLPPWQLLEFFNPRACGQNAPENHRWTVCFSKRCLPYDSNWFLSLYMGLIPLVFVLASVRLRRRKVFVVATSNKQPIKRQSVPRGKLQLVASWILLLSVLASLGAFAPGWLLRMCHAIDPNTNVNSFADGDPVGGVYWLCNVLIPKFSSFRFPAKLMTLAVWAMTVLVAIGWDCLRRRRVVVRIVWSILLVNVVVGLILLLGGWKMLVPSVQVPGPSAVGYDAKSVWFAMMYGTCHAVFMAVIVLVFCMGIRGQRSKAHSKRLSYSPKVYSRSTKYSCLVVAIVFCDLFFANRVLVVSVPDKMFREKNGMVDLIRKETPQQVEPIRYYSFLWSPQILKEKKPFSTFFTLETNTRQKNLLAWHRQALWGKMGHEFAMANTDHPGTMTPLEYFLLGDWLMYRRFSTDPIHVLSFLGTEYFVYPEQLVERRGSRHSFTIEPEVATMIASGKSEQTTPSTDTGSRVLGCSLWKSASPVTRLRIYHNPPWLMQPRMSIFQLIDGGFFGDPEKGEFARFVKYTPNEVEMAVRLSSPGTLLIAEQYFPGWHATVYTQGEESGHRVKIDQAIGFMRSITLPAGEHLVVMSYCPKSFIIGLILSLIGWCCFLFILIHPWGKSKLNVLQENRRQGVGQE